MCSDFLCGERESLQYNLLQLVAQIGDNVQVNIDELGTVASCCGRF